MDEFLAGPAERSGWAELGGHGAAGILMDPDGQRAFIACGPDNYVAVLDLKTLEVTSHIDVGGEPDGLAWASRP